MQRRSLLTAALAALAATALPAWPRHPPPPPPARHAGLERPQLRLLQRLDRLPAARRLQVQAFDTGNTAVRQRLGLPEVRLLPHRADRRLRDRRPCERARDPPPAGREAQGLGLAVPGMPVGSPGMDGPEYGGRKDPYDVLLVLRDGSSRVYQSYFRS
jgi:hypothetical protein